MGLVILCAGFIAVEHTYKLSSKDNLTQNSLRKFAILVVFIKTISTLIIRRASLDFELILGALSVFAVIGYLINESVPTQAYKVKDRIELAIPAVVSVMTAAIALALPNKLALLLLCLIYLISRVLDKKGVQ